MKLGDLVKVSGNGQVRCRDEPRDEPRDAVVLCPVSFGEMVRKRGIRTGDSGMMDGVGRWGLQVGNGWGSGVYAEGRDSLLHQ